MSLDEALSRLSRLLRGKRSLPGSRQTGDEGMDFFAGETRDGVQIDEVLP
jgi:hypothetical protein